jgi:hypothetical protein
MAIRNIIQKAEQEFPPAIKQELDPVARPELALLSGYVDTVNTNLATTGSTLNTKVDTLSGYSNTTFATITNLASTGSNLQSQINNLDSVYATDASVTTVANNLATTGSTLQTNINTVATNLASTGSANLARINSLSGTLTSTYATIANLATTGSSLQSQINNLDSVYATDASVTTVANNLATTGSTLNTKVDNLSGYSNNTFYTKNNPSGFITNENVVFTSGDQAISGTKTFINNTNFSGTLNFNTENTGEVSDGQMNWNNDYGTLQIGMDNGNVINTVGFKSFYRIKAAENIRKGKVVMALGGVGNSEYILAREAQNIGNSGQLIIGVSAEVISTNNFGDVVAFGAVRGINTASYPADSILYYDTSSTGEFTNISPQAPNAKVIVAFNTASSNNGIIFVRVTAGSQLGGTDGNVKFSTLQDNDFIKYNLASGYWENKQLTTGDVSGVSNLVTNLGGANGIQVMTTGAYNSGTPLSGVVYILI